jgi:protein TonB
MAMQFSHTNHGSGSKVSKFALVAGLHVAIGALFIHSINSRHISLSSLPEQVLVVLKPEPQEPPPPPEPPKPMPKLAPPDVFVPAPEVDVAPPPEPAPFQPSTTTEPEPSPFPSAPAEPMPQAQPAATPSANAGRMRTAVLADAKACALPDYPARAAREGISGTTVLALLVGPDGRVTSARVEHGSGSKDLDKAAINALSLCRFKPATSNGVPEAAWASLAYVWTLD